MFAAKSFATLQSTLGKNRGSPTGTPTGLCLQRFNPFGSYTHLGAALSTSRGADVAALGGTVGAKGAPSTKFAILA